MCSLTNCDSYRHCSREDHCKEIEEDQDHDDLLCGGEEGAVESVGQDHYVRLCKEEEKG